MKVEVLQKFERKKASQIRNDYRKQGVQQSSFFKAHESKCYYLIHIGYSLAEQKYFHLEEDKEEDYSFKFFEPERNLRVFVGAISGENNLYCLYKNGNYNEELDKNFIEAWYKIFEEYRSSERNLKTKLIENSFLFDKYLKLWANSKYFLSKGSNYALKYANDLFDKYNNEISERIKQIKDGFNDRRKIAYIENIITNLHEIDEQELKKRNSISFST